MLYTVYRRPQYPTQYWTCVVALYFDTPVDKQWLRERVWQVDAAGRLNYELRTVPYRRVKLLKNKVDLDGRAHCPPACTKNNEATASTDNS